MHPGHPLPIGIQESTLPSKNPIQSLSSSSYGRSQEPRLQARKRRGNTVQRDERAKYGRGDGSGAQGEVGLGPRARRSGPFWEGKGETDTNAEIKICDQVEIPGNQPRGNNNLQKEEFANTEKFSALQNPMNANDEVTEHWDIKMIGELLICYEDVKNSSIDSSGDLADNLYRRFCSSRRFFCTPQELLGFAKYLEKAIVDSHSLFPFLGPFKYNFPRIPFNFEDTNFVEKSENVIPPEADTPLRQFYSNIGSMGLLPAPWEVVRSQPCNFLVKPLVGRPKANETIKKGPLTAADWAFLILCRENKPLKLSVLAEMCMAEGFDSNALRPGQTFGKPISRENKIFKTQSRFRKTKLLVELSDFAKREVLKLKEEIGDKYTNYQDSKTEKQGSFEKRSIEKKENSPIYPSPSPFPPYLSQQLTDKPNSLIPILGKPEVSSLDGTKVEVGLEKGVGGNFSSAEEDSNLGNENENEKKDEPYTYYQEDFQFCEIKM